MTRQYGRIVLAVVGVAALAVACGSKSSSSPTSPSSATNPTITITANGIDPVTLRIDVNQRVTFMNSSSSNREMHSAPHPLHTDCPPTNELPILAPGQSGRTGAYTIPGTCRFHDHNNPDNAGFHGQILVAVSEPGPGGTYSTPGGGQ